MAFIQIEQEGMPAQPTRPTHPCEPKPQPHVSINGVSKMSRTSLPKMLLTSLHRGSSQWGDVRAIVGGDVRAIVEDPFTETWFCPLDSHGGPSGWVALAPLLEDKKACTRAIYRKKIGQNKHDAWNLKENAYQSIKLFQKYFYIIQKNINNIFTFCHAQKIENSFFENWKNDFRNGSCMSAPIQCKFWTKQKPFLHMSRCRSFRIGDKKRR